MSTDTGKPIRPGIMGLASMLELKLRGQEDAIEKLRSALVGVVGVDGKRHLELMEEQLQRSDASEHDKIVSIAAVRALLETL